VKDIGGDPGVAATALAYLAFQSTGEDTVADTAASARDRQQCKIDYECMHEDMRGGVVRGALTVSIVWLGLLLGKGRAREDECREDGGTEHLVEVFQFGLVSTRLLGPCFYSSGTH
jgi:hypothetical protein